MKDIRKLKAGDMIKILKPKLYGTWLVLGVRKEWFPGPHNESSFNDLVVKIKKLKYNQYDPKGRNKMLYENLIWGEENCLEEFEVVGKMKKEYKWVKVYKKEKQINWVKRSKK